ncbi:MAG: hypothetical protein K8L97_05560 [Anaerolineae bacterium]|nr:hypothetical protein [Anaerolineae bacterium]
MRSIRRLWPGLIVVIAAAAFIIWQIVGAGGSGSALGGLTALKQLTARGNVQLLNIMLSPDGTLAAVNVNGTADGPADSLRMVDMINGRTLWEFLDENQQFVEGYMLGFVSNGSAFAITGKDAERGDARFVRFFDTANGDILDEALLEGNERGLAASTTHYVVEDGTTLTIRNRADGQTLFTHQFESGSLELARFTTDEKIIWVARGGDGYKLYRIELANPVIDEENVIHITDLPVWRPASAMLSAGGKWLGVNIINGRGVAVIDLEAGRTHHYIPNSSLSSEAVDEVRLDPGFGFFRNEQFLAYMTNEGVVYAVDLKTNTLVDSFDPKVGTFPEMMAISADERTLGVLTDDLIAGWRLPEPPA